MLSDCHPHEAQLPAAEWALQTAHVGFLSHVKGSTHVLSCFHLGARSWRGWDARIQQRMAGHLHSSCTTSTSLQGPESSMHCWHSAVLQHAASAAGLLLLPLWPTPCFSMSHLWPTPCSSSQTIHGASRNAEEVGLLQRKRLSRLHPHSARPSPRPSCVQPEACHTAHTASAFSGSIGLALVWLRCNQSPLESPASALLSEFP